MDISSCWSCCLPANLISFLLRYSCSFFKALFKSHLSYGADLPCWSFSLLSSFHPSYVQISGTHSSWILPEIMLSADFLACNNSPVNVWCSLLPPVLPWAKSVASKSFSHFCNKGKLSELGAWSLRSILGRCQTPCKFHGCQLVVNIPSHHCRHWRNPSAFQTLL